MQNKLNVPLTDIEASDLLLAIVEWTSLNDQRVARIQEWQRMETQLFSKAKRSCIAVQKYLKTDRPEVETMKALDRRIEELGQLTEDLAAKILSLPAESLAEAIAKIEVGLKIQGPEDWQPYALDLVEDGLGALRKQPG